MFIPATTLQAMLAGLDAIGLDAAAIGREVGVLPEPNPALDDVYPGEVIERLWAAAFAHAPRAELPTEAGLAVPMGAFGALDYLADSAADVEAGLRAMAANFRLAATAFAIEVDTSERGGVRVVTPRTFPARDAGDEFGVALLVQRFRDAAGRAFGVRAVQLTRARPRRSRHAELLGAPVRFGAECAGFDLAPEVWRAPLQRANPALQRVLQQLVSRLEPVPVATALELTVRGHLRRLLPEGEADQPTVAGALGLSVRTLHRRLVEAGTSYREVLEHFRVGEAERLLLNGVPLTEVALRLGFSDQTTWNRAFRRWKGASPRAWLAASAGGWPRRRGGSGRSR